MMLALIGLACAAVLELMCIVAQKYNKQLSALLIALTTGLLVVSSTAAVVQRPNLSLILIWVFSVYKVINLLRLGVARLQPKHLRHVSLRTSLALTIMQACLLIIWVLIQATYYPDREQWVLLTGLAALVAVYLNTVISWRLFMQRPIVPAVPPASLQMPTVSVLIPARNETDELQLCLDAWIRSDYPKLEIIVLDDCSQTSRTPEIIRQFAHAGVRFIPGKPVKRGWLAKNQAYQVLAAEATGEMLVFCGVDARVEPNSLRLLIMDFYAQQLQMVSVMPRNYLQAGKIAPIQLMRYARELVRSPWTEQPPILSTLWLIRTSTLQALGGFAAVKRSVLPESYFGRVLHDQKQYAFWIGETAHGVASSKSLDEQYETAVRTLYPSFHKQPEVVATTSTLLVLTSLYPLLMLITALFSEDWLLALISFVGSVVVLGSYRMVLHATYGEARASHVYSWPLAVLSWLKGLHYSLYKYEFSDVEWKGRNICMPVMNRVDPQPRLAQVRYKYRKR
jgi:hypothetical protein